MTNLVERNYPKEFPPQEQDFASMPGSEEKMNPPPMYDAPWYKGSGKLAGRVAIITGGDSGIGRAVAVLYAREGCNVVISYLEQHQDAEKTKQLVEKEGTKCLLVPGDISKKAHCFDIVKRTIDTFGRLDVLVNHAGKQWKQDNFEDISEDQLRTTFETNVYSVFYMTQAALPHLKPGACIINTTSVNTYKGNKMLMDYSSSKAAICTLTYSLSEALVERGIRVNGVAPGPIWTPFIPSSFPADQVKEFGHQTTMGRAGQPEECAPCYVFLATQDSSYISGQNLHPNGGVIVGS